MFESNSDHAWIPKSPSSVRCSPRLVRPLAGVVVLIAMSLLAGCPGIPNDGRYQDHDCGRSNFRA